MRRFLFPLLAMLLQPAWVSAAQNGMDAPHAVRRILFVYENDSTQPAAVEIAAGLRSGLDSEFPMGVEIYAEHLDIQRFPGAARLAHLADEYAAKYRGTHIDVALAAGSTALHFMLAHRSKIAPGAPLVFGAIVDPGPMEKPRDADVGGVISRFDVGRTIKLAQQLQPHARRIVVLTGSAPFDLNWEKSARATLEAEQPDIQVDYLNGLSVEGFKTQVRSLTADDILLILTVVQDAEGRRFVPRDVAGEIAQAANAPTYGVYSTYLGRGIVGGYLETFDSIGMDMAMLVKEILEGRAGPRVIQSTGRVIVDWRQMQRWDISMNRLPTNADVRFYEPTAWQRYRPQILTLIAVIVLQGATISILIVQDWRRRRAERELAQGRTELAHLSRASQLGELSGAFAHELNQPLTSILANAEAGISMLRRGTPDSQELREIFTDIVEDDKRAAGVISQLRRLMMKGEAELLPMDLNRAVAATVALAHSELLSRNTQLDFQPDRPVLEVKGNFEQIQQVILNLILNASEAMAHLPPTERRIAIRTRTRHDGFRELIVSDRGSGLSHDMREKIFQPFVTTKANGLGLGLAICRTIAQAHGGTLKFDDQFEYGARIIFALPPL